jgi:hypothetical protein
VTGGDSADRLQDTSLCTRYWDRCAADLETRPKTHFSKCTVRRLDLAVDTNRWETLRFNGVTLLISVPQMGKRQSDSLIPNLVRLERRARDRPWTVAGHTSLQLVLGVH